MKIACAQFAPALGEVEFNLDTIRRLLLSADADLVVFPELATTGYFFRDKSEIESLGEGLNGTSVAALKAMALESGKAIVTGFLETTGDIYFNSAIAIDCNGELAGHYRKVHRFYFETQIFERGDLGFPVFPVQTRSGLVSTGIMICYDWRFPEAARALALNGAELIAAPSNIVTKTGMLHAVLQVRAFENKVTLAFADRIGQETNGNETLTFRGESAILSYNGEILACASLDMEEVIAAEIDLSKTREKSINEFNDLFDDRSPASYASIATQSPSPAKTSGEKKL